MECDPTLSEDVGQRAWPWLRERLLQLVIAVPPSMKVTLPAGVPAPGLLAVTVAVKVTDCLNIDGLAEELADVVVPYFTVCVSLEEVLPLKLASPPYDALIEWEPTASVLVTNVAWPELFSVPVPRVLEPSLKVTVPVGVPAPGLFAATVAVKVTGCPNTDGWTEEVSPVVVPGSVVVVVDADVVVEVIAGGAVVVEVADVVVVVGSRAVVVVDADVVVEVVAGGAVVVEVVDVVVVVGSRVVVVVDADVVVEVVAGGAVVVEVADVVVVVGSRVVVVVDADVVVEVVAGGAVVVEVADVVVVVGSRAVVVVDADVVVAVVCGGAAF